MGHTILPKKNNVIFLFPDFARMVPFSCAFSPGFIHDNCVCESFMAFSQTFSRIIILSSRSSIAGVSSVVLTELLHLSCTDLQQMTEFSTVLSFIKISTYVIPLISAISYAIPVLVIK